MVPKLYRVAENTYAVADDIFIQHGEGNWVASEILEEASGRHEAVICVLAVDSNRVYAAKSN